MSKPSIPNEIIPKSFKEMIVNELILPAYRENIQYTIRTRTCWSVVCTVCLTSSTILIGISSLLSFSSSSFPDANMGFIAGSVGIIAVLLKEFSSYANSQDHLKTVEMNEILKNIGIDFTFEDTSGLEKRLINQLEQRIPSPPPASPPTPPTPVVGGAGNTNNDPFPNTVSSNDPAMVSNPMIIPPDFQPLNHIVIQQIDPSGNIIQ